MRNNVSTLRPIFLFPVIFPVSREFYSNLKSPRCASYKLYEQGPRGVHLRELLPPVLSPRCKWSAYKAAEGAEPW
jgi:hypothetical protein